MVKVYLADIKSLPNGIVLSKKRQEIYNNLKNNDDKKRSLAVGLLLNLICKEYNIDIDSYYLSKTGKPYLDGIYISISHSKNYVICAVGNDIVGADIEKIESEHKRVIDKYFTVKEQSYVENTKDFYRLWTLKESFLKMTGEGLKALKNIEIDISNEISLRYNNTDIDCHFKEFIYDNYYISVCSKSNQFSDQIIKVC